jgi:hypothetical protein
MSGKQVSTVLPDATTGKKATMIMAVAVVVVVA